MQTFDKLYRGEVGKRDAAPAPRQAPATDTLPQHLDGALDEAQRALKAASNPVEKAAADALGTAAVNAASVHLLLKSAKPVNANTFFNLGDRYRAGR